MNIRIDRKNPLGLKEQVKGQIKALIQSGALQPGQMLPSARDLAALLNLNRNTTWAAYRDLSNEGWLLASRGAGTFVAPGGKREGVGELEKLFAELVNKARDLGFEPESLTDHFLSFLAQGQTPVSGKRVLVVECNQETLDGLALVLERDLGVETGRVLIQDLEDDPELGRKKTSSVDLVVTGFNHLAEFHQAVPECAPEVVPVMLAPDLRLVAELSRLKPGTRVGFTCVNARSTESLYKHQVFSAGVSLQRILVGMDDPAGIEDMLARCDVIFASMLVYERLRAIAAPGKRIVRVDIEPEPAGLELVRQALMRGGGQTP